MLYHSIRLGVSYVLLAAVMVALPVHAQQEQKAETPEPGKATDPKLEEMKKLKEQFEACQQELDRIMQQLMEGRGTPSSYKRTIETCGAAKDAIDANRIASDPSPELKKRVKPELIERAKETSSRMLAQFEQNGINASFSSSDSREVAIFQLVALVVQVLQLADSPTVTKDVDPAVVEAAKTTATAILSRFNEQGYGMVVSSWEQQPLQQFISQAKEKNK